VSYSVLVRKKNVSAKFCRENENMHFRFHYFFFPENRTIHVKICTDFSAVRATDDKIAHEHGIVDTQDYKLHNQYK